MHNGARRKLESLPCRFLLIVPVLLAASAFSYALATSSARDCSAVVRATGAGTLQPGMILSQPLRFTNPLLLAGADPLFPNGGGVSADPQGFDLGDACAGSAITRYLTAAGGYLPYTFALQPLAGSISSSWSPALGVGGIVSGAIPATAVERVRFNAQLTDITGAQRVGAFTVGVYAPSATPFRFAQDRLPTAQQNNTYFATIETLGGPAVFSVLPGSIAVKGTKTPFNQIEDVGLTLAPDGTLFGRPTKSGDITFTARAENGASVALNRTSSAIDQKFTLKLETGMPVTSELTATSCTLRGNTVAPGEDSFAYSGVLDSRGLKASDLAGAALTLRVGGAVFSSKLDAKARINQTLSASGKKSRFTAAVCPACGFFKAKVTGVDLASKLSLPANLSAYTFQTLVICLDVGAFRTCEVLRVETLARTHGSFRMDYALGKHGFSRAGAFQVLSVKALDSSGTAARPPLGDRWSVRVLAVPSQDIETSDPTAPNTSTTGTTTGTTGSTGSTTGTTAAASTTAKKASAFPAPAAPAIVASPGQITVWIGDGFAEQITGGTRTTRYIFKTTDEVPGINKLVFDSRKFAHWVDTNHLRSTITGIPPAITAKNAAIFPIQFDIRSFSGQSGRIIYPQRDIWKHQ